MSHAHTGAHCLQINHLEIAHIKVQELTFHAGQAVSLQGPSGCGKSLFLKALADLMNNEGSLFLNGTPRSDMPAPNWRRKVCYLSARTAWWHERVADHFHDPKAIMEGLKAFDLPEDIINKPVSELSSGEAQRLAILRTLANQDACFFLLDEPTSALDETRQIKVEDYLKSDMERRGFGLIFVSHDERQIERLGERRLSVEDNTIRELEHD